MSGLDANIQQNISGSGNIFTATGDVFVIQKPESATEHQLQTNLRILLNKVRTFWVQGVLEKSIHHAVLINLEKEVRTDSVDHPWGMVLELPDNERHTLPPKTDILEIFNQSTRALLILGEPGSGKTTTLLDLARKLIEKGEQDISTEPIPVVFNLSSWGTSKSLFDWLVKELSDKYQIPKKIGKSWLEQNRVLPLLDGFDEIAEGYRQNCIIAINEFIGAYGLPGLVVCSRITEYTKLPVRLKLNAAICVQPLSDKQIDQYLKLALGKDHALKGLLKKDDLLASLAKTPLFLSVLCLAHRSSPEEVKNLSADSSEEYTQKLFDIYFERILKRKGGKNPYPPEQVQKTLSWLAKRMAEQNQSVFYVEQLQPTWLPLLKEQLIYYVLSRASLWFLIGFFGSIGFVTLSYIWISGIIGVVLGFIGGVIGFFDWHYVQKADNRCTVGDNNISSRRRRSNNWVNFIFSQYIIFSSWLSVIYLFFYANSYLFQPIFSVGGTNSSESSGSILVDLYMYLLKLLIELLIEPLAYLLQGGGDINQVIYQIVWILLPQNAIPFLLLLFILEAFLFVLIIKFWNFLKLLIDAAATTLGVLAYLVLNIALAYFIGIYIYGNPIFILLLYLMLNAIYFVLLWKFENVLKIVSKSYLEWWIVLAGLICLILFFVRGVNLPIIPVFLMPFFVSTILLSIIKGFNGRNKEILKDIRTTESLSWSWKSSLPIIIITIPSLLFFIYTSNPNNDAALWNDVTLWDSKTGRIISNLQKKPSIHWDASFSNDGSRILLLGGEASSAQAYLYDSISGELISEMGAYQYPVVNASFNSAGSRLLVEGTGECPLWCYAQLWNAETGKLVSPLNVDQVLKAKDIGEFNLGFDKSWFGEDDYLIFSPIYLNEKTEDKLVKSGYMVWDVETGNPILFFFSNFTQNSPEFYLGYIFPGNENRLTVEMDQISDLIIYDDNVLKQHPLTIRNLNGNNRTCYWYVKSQNIDCTSPKYGINPWEPHIFSVGLSTMFGVDFDSGLAAALDAGQLTDPIREGFQNNGNPLSTITRIEVEQTGSKWVIDDTGKQYQIRKTGQYLTVYFPSSWSLSSPFSQGTYYSGLSDYSSNDYSGHYESKLALRNRNIEYGGINLPIDVYPFSRVFFIENPVLPKLITITGDNPLKYGVGLFSVLAIVTFFVIGLKTNVIENKVLPNQGILLSVRNSLILGEIAVIVFGLIISVIFANQWMYIWGIGILAGTFVWVLYGGMDAVYHYTLRAILSKRDYLPWKLVPFLDYCADNLLLQKVGGGYIFIHRMLLENLAKKAKN